MCNRSTLTGMYFNGSGPASNWNVFIYTDSASLPGTQIFSATNQPVSVVGTTFTVNLPTPAVLAAGTYWIEIQANMTFATQGEWGWTDRTVQSNSPAAWQNPGGGFGSVRLGCQSWRSAFPLQAALTRCTGSTEPRAVGTGTPVTYTNGDTCRVHVPIRQAPAKARSRLATPTQATIAMIAPLLLASRSRSAFTGRPLTVRTSPQTAAWTS